jgi:hypothetical protein
MDDFHKSTREFASQLEAFDKNLLNAKTGAGPAITEKAREKAVALIEKAMSLRIKEVGGTDVAARAADKMLEPHQFAAMSSARTLAAYDGNAAENPFSHPQLKQAYKSEKALLSSNAYEAGRSNTEIKGAQPTQNSIKKSKGLSR